MNRRDFIRHLGIGICAGAAVPFVPSLIPDLIGSNSFGDIWKGTEQDLIMSTDQISFSELLKLYYGSTIEEEIMKRDYVMKGPPKNIGDATIAFPLGSVMYKGSYS